MPNGDFKDLLRRTASDKVFRDKKFNIIKNSKYYGYQRKLASMVYNIFIKHLPELILQVVMLHVQTNLLLKVKLCLTKH